MAISPDSDATGHAPAADPARTGAARLFSRLDHIGIAVWQADRWLPYYRDILGLPLVGDEPCEERGSRLVYFDAGNAFVQLVEPVSPDCDLRDWLRQHGEGLHHVCLATDDLEDVRTLGQRGPVAAVPTFQAGRGRRACFLAEPAAGVQIEVTETNRSL